MGAWRGSVFTSGHVLSLELAKPPVHAVNVNGVKQDAISCNRNLRVKLFKEFNRCSSAAIRFSVCTTIYEKSGSKPNTSNHEIPSRRYSST